jgi:hypothetical protein
MLAVALGASFLWLGAFAQQRGAPPFGAATDAAGQQAAAIAAETNTGSVAGLVVRLGTNEPISGVEVELTLVEPAPAAPGDTAPAIPAEDPVGLGRGGGRGGARGGVRGGGRGQPVFRPEILPHSTTGENGRFVFSNLRPGTYTLVAQEGTGAYNPAEYGQRDPRGPGKRLTLTAGQSVNDVRLEMAPAGSISGRIVDEYGLPMGHVGVQALELDRREGLRILNTVQYVQTNDKGEFRLFWLPPGRYVVAAKVEDFNLRSVPLLVKLPGTAGTNSRAGAPVVSKRTLPSGEVVEEIHRIVYNGNVVDPEQARPLDLSAGGNLTNVAISMAPGKTRARHIRGVLINGPTGQPISGIPIRVTQIQSTGNRVFFFGGADERGVFDICCVPPGAMNLLSIATNGQSSGSVDVVVGDDDVNGVRLGVWPAAAAASAAFTGRVTIEGRAVNDPDLTKLSVSALWGGQEPGFYSGGAAQTLNAPVQQDGTFRRPIGIFRGRFRVSISGLSSGMYVKSMRVGERNVIADGMNLGGDVDAQGQPPPLEIDIAKDGGTPEGFVVNEKKERMANVVVALVPDFPIQRARPELYRSAVTGANGEFQLPAVPPGDYKLFAWEYAEPGIWLEEEFMQPYEALGKRVQLGGGNAKDIEVTVISKNR